MNKVRYFCEIEQIEALLTVENGYVPRLPELGIVDIIMDMVMEEYNAEG